MDTFGTVARNIKSFLLLIQRGQGFSLEVTLENPDPFTGGETCRGCGNAQDWRRSNRPRADFSRKYFVTSLEPQCSLPISRPRGTQIQTLFEVLLSVASF